MIVRNYKHDCAKLYICIANAMKSAPTLWAQNTDFFKITKTFFAKKWVDISEQGLVISLLNTD